MIDQGAVSLGNFMTQIILARSLSHSDYGVFTLLFGVLLLFLTCQGGLVTYPLSLKGASVENAELRRLTFASLVFTTCLSVSLAPLIFGVTLLLKVVSLSWVIILAMLLWQVQETYRRALMAHLRHRDAVWGDSLSYLGQAVALWILAHRGALTLERAFFAVALSSAAGALLQWSQLGLAAMPLRRIRALGREYWSVGRWALCTSVNDAASRQAFPWALAFLYSPAEAASFQAVMNVLGVSHPVLFSANNLIVPAAASARKKGGVRAAWNASWQYGFIGTAILVPYFCLLLILPHAVLSFTYGRFSSYANFGLGLRLGALAYAFWYVGVVFAAFLYSLGRSKLALAASLGGTVLALVPAGLCIVHFGVIGAIEGFLMIGLARLGLSAGLAKRVLKQESKSDAALNRSTLAATPLQVSGINERANS